MSAADLLLTDLTIAEPRAAWTDADSHVHRPIAPRGAAAWRVLDYRTALYDGRALTTADPQAPTLRLPLNRTGWHAVSIGLAGRHFGLNRIAVRLTGDRHWQALSAPASYLREEPWCFADLTGRALELRFDATGGDNEHAALYCVRARPVAPEDVPTVSRRRHRPMVYFNDGHGIFYLAARPGRHIVAAALGAFADSDWDICCFGVGGADLVNYAPSVGTLMGEDAWYTPRRGDRNLNEVLHALLDQGVDPFRQAVEVAHAQGHTVWAYIRPQAWVLDSVCDHAFRSRFYTAHPEYRCREADGRALSKLSLAFPAVRAQLNAIARETLERGADGVCLTFNRGFPLVRYEAPVCDAWRAQHGGDARQLPESDPRLQVLWGDFVTAWLGELRALLDAAPAPGGGRRPLTVMLGDGPAWGARFGLDVGRWAAAGLVDAVMLYPTAPGRSAELDVSGTARLLAGTRTQLLPSLGSCFDHGTTTLRDYRRRAHRFYAAGAHGLARWDTDEWLARVALDDPELNALWCAKYLGPEDHDLTEIGGLAYAPFSPSVGF